MRDLNSVRYVRTFSQAPPARVILSVSTYWERQWLDSKDLCHEVAINNLRGRTTRVLPRYTDKIMNLRFKDSSHCLFGSPTKLHLLRMTK